MNKSEFSINYEKTQKEIKEKCLAKRQAYDLASAVLRSPAPFSLGPQKNRPERMLQVHNNTAILTEAREPLNNVSKQKGHKGF